MRAALYARYSSERQNERSAADQLAALERHAEVRGWSVVARFSDEAISGAAIANRPGLRAALASAEAGAFEMLLTEHEDRIARNLEHLAHVAGRLERADVCLATIATDRVGTLHVAFNGALAQEYLVNLGQKTSRGMRANAEAGRATGSRLYGYRTEPGGATAIVEAEAAVVREICSRYAAGERVRQVAYDLNTRGVPGPRGGGWNVSTLLGSRSRGNGIVRTEQYAGVKVWNGCGS